MPTRYLILLDFASQFTHYKLVGIYPVVIELSKRKVFIILSILVVLIAVPITIFISQRSTEDRSHASEGPTDSQVVETFNGDPITRGDIKAVAQEQYDPAGISTNVLKDALATLEERKTLDLEAQNLSLTPDSAQIQKVADEEDLTPAQARYEVLRDMVTLADVNSVEVLSVGAWTPKGSDNPLGLDSSDVTNAVSQAEDFASAAPQISASLKTGDDVLAIASATTTKYPTLADIIAVNGTKLNGLDESEKTAAADPEIIEFGDSNLDPSIQTALFAMNESDVQAFTNTETNSAGVVYKLVKKGNDQGSPTYNEWLSQKLSTLVIPKNPL